MLAINTDKRSLEDFGKTLAIVLFLLSSYWDYKGHTSAAHYLFYAALVFSFVSFFMPRSIKYLYIYWIKMANVISNAITKIILFLVYFLFITPYSLLAKLVKRDILNIKIDPDASSYWVVRERKPIDLDTYKRQF